MLDIKFIRENKDLITAGAQKKHVEFNVEELLTVDDERRGLMTSIEQKRGIQNQFSEKIPQTEDQVARARMIEEMKTVKAELQLEEDKLKEVMKKWQGLMVRVPNVPDVSVPEGASDADNQEVRTWGEIPKFPYAPRSHIELLELNDMIEFDRGTKVSGFRGYFLKNDAAMLQWALEQFVMDEFAKKGDFTPIIAPSLVRREPFIGTGYLPQSEEDLYKTQDDLYLAGTAEVPTMGLYMDEVLDAGKLPIKFIAYSPCFRREAGSHGKDTRGIIRVHEFHKLEQVVLCAADHAESVKLHEELTNNSEKLLQTLGIPYHVVVNCGGDLGLGQVKKYDIEAWVPSENKYRETHSSSYFHDFQTRRLNIRYKDAEGKMKFVHSLNNTAMAFPRILVPVIENNQQEDGSIRIPEVLQKYMGGRTVIQKK
ncbi:MAG: serine--tRNA ligase [Candidatus Paceibacterota bacterium]|jgi:seryl-tRNA synthetase